MAQHTNQLDASVDALSDILDIIRLRGEALTVVRAGASADIRHRAGERLLHLVEDGPVELVAGAERATLEQGDTVLVATGATHQLRASSGSASWMSGRFLVEEKAAGPLLSVLPPVIVVRKANLATDWLPLAAQLLALEMSDPSPGSRVMVSRLLDLAFIQVLRTWSAGDQRIGEPGWLTAALDRQLGPALRAIHRHPEQPWPVEELADISAMSRAAFAARFTDLVGDPPGRYLTRLRLARAADQLMTTTSAVGAIGRAVGYESEAAFSRAFGRAYGVSPREWRRTNLHAS